MCELEVESRHDEEMIEKLMVEGFGDPVPRRPNRNPVDVANQVTIYTFNTVTLRMTF